MSEIWESKRDFWSDPTNISILSVKRALHFRCYFKAELGHRDGFGLRKWHNRRLHQRCIHATSHKNIQTRYILAALLLACIDQCHSSVPTILMSWNWFSCVYWFRYIFFIFKIYHFQWRLCQIKHSFS